MFSSGSGGTPCSISSVPIDGAEIALGRRQAWGNPGSAWIDSCSADLIGRFLFPKPDPFYYYGRCFLGEEEVADLLNDLGKMHVRFTGATKIADLADCLPEITISQMGKDFESLRPGILAMIDALSQWLGGAITRSNVITIAGTYYQEYSLGTGGEFRLAPGRKRLHSWRHSTAGLTDRAMGLLCPVFARNAAKFDYYGVNHYDRMRVDALCKDLEGLRERLRAAESAAGLMGFVPDFYLRNYEREFELLKPYRLAMIDEVIAWMKKAVLESGFVTASGP